MRLTARAYLDHRHGPQTETLSLRDYVDLPAGYNPRTLAWAEALRSDPRYANATPEQLGAGRDVGTFAAASPTR